MVCGKAIRTITIFGGPDSFEVVNSSLSLLILPIIRSPGFYHIGTKYTPGAGTATILKYPCIKAYSMHTFMLHHAAKIII